MSDSIKTLQSCLPECMMPDGADPCAGYHAAIDRIDELEAENEALKAQLIEWVNVAKDGLPDEPGMYLTYWSDGSVETYGIDEEAIALGHVYLPGLAVLGYWAESPQGPRPDFTAGGDSTPRTQGATKYGNRSTERTIESADRRLPATEPARN